MIQETYPLVFFAQLLNDLTLIEKQLAKFYLKLEKAAFTPELSKALSPGHTEAEQHLQRLTLIKQAIGKQNINKSSKPEIPSLKLNLKAAGYPQDLNLILKVLALQNTKLSYYEILHPIAAALEMEIALSLLEQSITDNRNTNTWLRQIIQNVIVPGMG